MLDLQAGFYSIFVYSNVVQHGIVGDTYAPLLRVCKISGKPGEMVTSSYEKPMYVPISQSSFDHIEINLRDDSGSLVPFQLGKVYATLHFKRDFSTY